MISYPHPHGPVTPLLVPVFIIESPTKKRAGCWRGADGLVVACPSAPGGGTTLNASRAKTKIPQDKRFMTQTLESAPPTLSEFEAIGEEFQQVGIARFFAQIDLAFVRLSAEPGLPRWVAVRMIAACRSGLSNPWDERP